MHGYYVNYRDIYSPTNKSTGIDRKVVEQIKAFNDAGLDCEYLLCLQPESTLGKVASCLPFASDGISWAHISSLECPDYLYIRRPRFASRQLVSFLQAVRTTWPQVHILYEIPTYPYDNEMKVPYMYPALLKDRAHRQKLFDYVDAFVLLVDTDEVFGHPAKTLRIKNGIDLAATRSRTPATHKESFDVVCSALFSFWHGIDRFIAGMVEARALVAERHVVLHLAGEGPALASAKRLVAQHRLEDYVVFHGMMNHAELGALFDTCDFAVECLGIHRRDAKIASSSIKSREYLAKGIPFVYSGHIDLFDEDPVDFCFEVPADESPVDLAGMLEFSDALYADGQEPVIARIRAYAEAHVSWQTTMAPVFEYLRERLS